MAERTAEPLARPRIDQIAWPVFTAFCEALCPPGSPMPAAQREVEVSERVREFLATGPPRIRRQLALGLGLLQMAPLPQRRGKPFTRLDLPARAACLEELDRSRLVVVRELVGFLKALALMAYGADPLVQERIGYATTCRVANSETPPLEADALDPKRLRAPGGDISADVIVVGSGAGGAVVARHLARRGVDVAVLEAGDYYDRRTYLRDPVDSLVRLYRDNGMTACEGRVTIPLPVGSCVGGTTLINSGTCFRLPERVMDEWRTRLGIDWARPEVLDPIFERLEQDLRVRPVDVETMGRNGQLCLEGAAKLGASAGPISRYAGHCVECGTCPTGCAIDAKQATHVSLLPQAVASGARVFAGCRATSLVVGGGRVRGVDVEATGGRTLRAHAKVVVLAGGALGTPELLMRSGLSGPGTQVGGGLRVHPACWVGATHDEEVRGWRGIMQSAYVDEWSESHGLFLEATFTPLPFGGQWLPGFGSQHAERLMRYDRVASIGVHLSDHSTGRVRLDRRGNLRVHYCLTSADAARMLFGIARAAEIHFAAGARRVFPQLAGVASIAAGETDVIERQPARASEMKLEAFHPMGTCSMGADPRMSAVKPDGALRGVDRLYVADASILPTSLGVNPMITIMACAEQVASEVAERVDR